MNVFERNELKAHVLSLAMHSARATLFHEIALTREVEGDREESRRYVQKADQEQTYANNKQKLIWEWLDKL